MKRFITPILLAAALAAACTFDLKKHPEVSFYQTTDIQGGAGEVVLHFSPAPESAVTIHFGVDAPPGIELAYQEIAEVPAFTRNLILNVSVSGSLPPPGTYPITMRIINVWGGCRAGSPSEITFNLVQP